MLQIQVIVLSILLAGTIIGLLVRNSLYKKSMAFLEEHKLYLDYKLSSILDTHTPEPNTELTKFVNTLYDVSYKSIIKDLELYDGWYIKPYLKMYIKKYILGNFLDHQVLMCIDTNKQYNPIIKNPFKKSNNKTDITKFM